MTVLEPGEKSVAVGREQQVFPRRQRAFDAWDAHSQDDELPLALVMEFNADEREWQMERILRLSKAKQKPNFQDRNLRSCTAAAAGGEVVTPASSMAKYASTVSRAPSGCTTVNRFQEPMS